MKTKRILALMVTFTVAMGSFGIPASTAGRESAVGNLPVSLKNATLYMTGESAYHSSFAAVDSKRLNLYVVQFSGPVKEAYKTKLGLMGVEVGDYLPENAFLTRMTDAVRLEVGKLGYVQGIRPYMASWKIDQSLSGLTGTDRAAVRITTFYTGTKGPVAALSALGIRPESIGAGIVTASMDGDHLKELASSPEVVYLERIQTNQLFNDKAAGIMGLAKPWDLGFDGKGQVVAVTDTGLDTGKNDKSMHPDFQGQIKALFALGKPNDASDTLAHGTHVAGSVLGSGVASNGLHKGMAPGAKLVFQAVEDLQGGLSGIPEDLSQLFRQAYDAGARIHSNSWGVPATQGGTLYDGQSAAVDRFIWEHPDYAILFASGNDGDHDQDGQPNYNTVSTPGTAKNAITVGASQNNRPDKKMATNVNGIASFSSRGPTADGRVKPDLVAPGTWIVSTRSSLAQDKHFWAPFESNAKYGYMGGTSMATPLTAGATAVVRQYFMEELGVTPRASLLKAALINGAVSMQSNLGWQDIGWGRVDLKNTLFGQPFRFQNEQKALQTGEAQTYTYDVKAGKPLKATLVWSDYPANPSAEKSLVNDLDLVIKGPDGTEYLGNQAFIGGADRTNNVENALLPTPKAGTYSVTIRGHNVPQGPQPFSLVLSGDLDGGTSEPTPPPQDPKPNPPEADDQKPTIVIKHPAPGAALSGEVTITAEAADNVGVSKVTFQVDGQSIGSTTAKPYAVKWNSKQVMNGQHTLTAMAYDTAGNVGKAEAVAITVQNGAVTGRQWVQFTGKTSFVGMPARYFIDLDRGAAVQAELGLSAWASVALTALDPSGKQVASGPDALSFTAASSGTYTIAVISYGGWADYALSLTYPAAAATAQTNKSGSLASNGERYHVYPITMTKAGSLSGLLTASDKRADLDLYLVDSMGRLLSQATSPNLNPETVSAYLSAGTYYLYVVVDSGQTDYQLKVLHPE